MIQSQKLQLESKINKKFVYFGRTISGGLNKAPLISMARGRYFLEESIGSQG